jgi:catechol 2,3-dioxygenase
VSIGHVHLKVADLNRAIAFYCGALGFDLMQRYGHEAAFLSAGGCHHHIALNAWESKGRSPPAPHTTGLYHVAIRYPTRASLADALRRLIDAGISLEGASDHGVSEALYLRDPDQNGIELSWDRPKAGWPPRARYARIAEGTDCINAELLIPAWRELLLRLPTAGGLMSYINHALQPGETLRYRGSTHWMLTHWMLYFPAILLLVVGLVILIVRWAAPQPYGLLVAIACFVLGFVLAIRAWWIRWNTEIAVTDRRVIYVRGFFARKSIEVHMNQIESVDVDQSLLGRLFGYGDVTIHGTGNAYDPLRAVDRPIALRNEIIAR